ncbi:hypothetical protein JI739_08525 [Ramlibacter sp. AW1]|uniref:Uncharacterized protein n=1 Tax=Ramlibacter aurantiacus TaxID=2801330 RepID=A0A936ZF41_9BURK|nr:hypothetical protein [Ramlibacter aurantiacus]MBL0420384.1 hypothetical protein [Ramlibacter aurantiacus]
MLAFSPFCWGRGPTPTAAIQPAPRDDGKSAPPPSASGATPVRERQVQVFGPIHPDHRVHGYARINALTTLAIVGGGAGAAAAVDDVAGRQLSSDGLRGALNGTAGVTGMAVGMATWFLLKQGYQLHRRAREWWDQRQHADAGAGHQLARLARLAQEDAPLTFKGLDAYLRDMLQIGEQSPAPSTRQQVPAVMARLAAAIAVPGISTQERSEQLHRLVGTIAFRDHGLSIDQLNGALLAVAQHIPAEELEPAQALALVRLLMEAAFCSPAKPTPRDRLRLFAALLELPCLQPHAWGIWADRRGGQKWIENAQAQVRAEAAFVPELEMDRSVGGRGSCSVKLNTLANPYFGQDISPASADQLFMRLAEISPQQLTPELCVGLRERLASSDRAATDPTAAEQRTLFLLDHLAGMRDSKISRAAARPAEAVASLSMPHTAETGAVAKAAASALSQDGLSSWSTLGDARPAGPASDEAIWNDAPCGVASALNRLASKYPDDATLTSLQARTARSERVLARLATTDVKDLPAEVQRAISVLNHPRTPPRQRLQHLIDILHRLDRRTDLPPGAFLEGLVPLADVRKLIKGLAAIDHRDTRGREELATQIAELPRLAQLAATPQLLQMTHTLLKVMWKPRGRQAAAPGEHLRYQKLASERINLRIGPHTVDKPGLLNLPWLATPPAGLPELPEERADERAAVQRFENSDVQVFVRDFETRQPQGSLSEASASHRPEARGTS